LLANWNASGTKVGIKMSREHKKIKGEKHLATKVANHPNFLKLGERGLKRLVKKIQKEK
jgi:hypothetical protein